MPTTAPASPPAPTPTPAVPPGVRVAALLLVASRWTMLAAALAAVVALSLWDAWPAFTRR